MKTGFFMTQPKETPGKVLFEHYLDTRHLPFEFGKLEEEKSRPRDYRIRWKGQTVLFDVKDIDQPHKPSRLTESDQCKQFLTKLEEARSKGQTVPFEDVDQPHKPWRLTEFDQYKQICTKLGEARKNFKEYNEFCCVLVLGNLRVPYVWSPGSYIALDAMYGNSGIPLFSNNTGGIVDPSTIEASFLGRWMMIRPQWSLAQNTTIAAIITLDAIPHEQLLFRAVSGRAPHMSQAEVRRRSQNWSEANRLITEWEAEVRRTITECEAELRGTLPNFDRDRGQFPRVIVWHNGFAQIPFPEDLFCGPFDIHFGIVEVGSWVRRQAMTYRGEGFPAR